MSVTNYDKYLWKFYMIEPRLQFLLNKDDVDIEFGVYRDWCILILQRLQNLTVLQEDVSKILKDSGLIYDLGNIVLTYLNYPKGEIHNYQHLDHYRRKTIYITNHKYKAILKFIEKDPYKFLDNIYQQIFFDKREYSLDNPIDVEHVVDDNIKWLDSRLSICEDEIIIC